MQDNCHFATVLTNIIMTVVMKTALNAANYVTTAHPINLVLLASAINRYQRDAFFQIASALQDFMIAIQHKQTARVIILRKLAY